MIARISKLPHLRPCLTLLLAAAGLGCGAEKTELLLADVALVDVEAGEARPGSNIEIADGVIERITRDPIDPTVAADRVEGLRGKYVIPGLWDMHVHVLWDDETADRFLPLFTRAGVTGIRDMGGSFEVLKRVRAEQESSWPRIVAAGRVLDGPRPVDPTISEAAGNAIEARAAIQRIRHGGGDFLKVYTLLPREAFFAATELARWRGMQVVGHVPAEVSPLEAAEAGLASIEHLRDGQGGLCAGSTETECAALPGRLAALGARVTPTLVVLEAKTIPGYVAPEDALDLASLPLAVAQYWRQSAAGQRQRGADYFHQRRRLLGERMKMVARLRDAGVPILAGTDTGTAFLMPGESLHRELALLVESGLTAPQALRAATVDACRLLDLADCGRIAAGYAADLVVLDADPLANIDNVKRIAAVVRNGRWLAVGREDSE